MSVPVVPNPMANVGRDCLSKNAMHLCSLFISSLSFSEQFTVTRKVKMHSNSFLIMFGAFALVVVSVGGADPDPLTDFGQGLKVFTLRDIFKNGDVSRDSGGVRAATTLAKFPAMQYVVLVRATPSLFIK